MIDFIIYSIEVAVCLVLFYSVYLLFLKNETFFKLNRFYLILSVTASLIMPLLNITMTTNTGDFFITKYLVLPVEKYEQSIMMNIDAKHARYDNHNVIPAKKDSKSEIDQAGMSTITTSSPSIDSPQLSTSQNINWIKVTLIIYFTGAALFFLRFLANFVWIFGYVLKHKVQKISGMNVIRSEKKVSPFSFLGFIVISNKEYPEGELEKIIEHEKVHIRQRHSVDLILFELVMIFQWFNPFVWLYKRAIRVTHEYLADQGTLNSGVDLSSYQYSLLNQVLLENNVEIVNNYNLSIKKRIAMMMKKRSSAVSRFKVIIALPVLVFLFSAFAIHTISPDNGDDGKKKLTQKDTAIKRVNVPLEYLKSLQGEYESTNEPGRTRRIVFTEVLGTLFGFDNGYSYRIIPVGEGKFINPDDHASLVFDTKDKNNVSLLLFGKIILKKIKVAPGEFTERSLAFSLVKVIVKDGPQAAAPFYKAVKDSTSNYYLTEFEMSTAGLELLHSGKGKEALALLKLNTEIFPTLFNSYDTYAEALLETGDKDQAAENFKKSFKLNPGSQNALKRFKELGVNPDNIVKVPTLSAEYLKSIEGDYLSTNDRSGIRWIRFAVEDGALTGTDNGYHYKLIPLGDGKFVNPDDGASLVFDTKNKNAIKLLLFGEINLNKVKTASAPLIDLKEYAGVYLPSKNDTILNKMEIRSVDNKLFRYIDKEPEGRNKNVELKLVTGHSFFYTDNSFRNIEFEVNAKKEVVGCTLTRWDGVYKLTKQK